MHGHDGEGKEFGAAREFGELPHVEFTDAGDVVVATYSEATVYSGTTLEPVGSWAWPDNVQSVRAIQAHRGLLYVACTMNPVGSVMEVHVYE